MGAVTLSISGTEGTAWHNLGTSGVWKSSIGFRVYDHLRTLLQFLGVLLLQGTILEHRVGRRLGAHRQVPRHNVADAHFRKACILLELVHVRRVLLQPSRARGFRLDAQLWGNIGGGEGTLSGVVHLHIETNEGPEYTEH